MLSFLAWLLVAGTGFLHGRSDLFLFLPSYVLVRSLFHSHLLPLLPQVLRHVERLVWPLPRPGACMSRPWYYQTPAQSTCRVQPVLSCLLFLHAEGILGSRGDFDDAVVRTSAWCVQPTNFAWNTSADHGWQPLVRMRPIGSFVLLLLDTWFPCTEFDALASSTAAMSIAWMQTAHRALVWFGLVWMQHVTTRWSTRLGRNSEVYVTTISVLSPQLDLDARATLLCVSVFSPSKSIKIWIQSLHSSWCMLHLLSISVDAPSVSTHHLCFPWLQKDCLLTIQSSSSSTRFTTLRLLTIHFVPFRLLSLYLHSDHHHPCFFHPRMHPFQF